jgi:hypothetical protein
MLSNALQVVITSLFMSVTMSVTMSAPFRFHARAEVVLLDVDDFRGQIGDRPFDEDKSAVCGGDYVAAAVLPRRMTADFKPRLVSDELLRRKRSLAVALGRIPSRLRSEHESLFR